MTSKNDPAMVKSVALAMLNGKRNRVGLRPIAAMPPGFIDAAEWLFEAGDALTALDLPALLAAAKDEGAREERDLITNWLMDPCCTGLHNRDINIASRILLLEHRAMTAENRNLPARDAAMLAQGRREGLEMAAEIVDCRDYGDDFDMADSHALAAAEYAAAAIRAKIGEVKS